MHWMGVIEVRMAALCIDQTVNSRARLSAGFDAFTQNGAGKGHDRLLRAALIFDRRRLHANRSMTPY